MIQLTKDMGTSRDWTRGYKMGLLERKEPYNLPDSKEAQKQYLKGYAAAVEAKKRGEAA